MSKLLVSDVKEEANKLTVEKGWGGGSMRQSSRSVAITPKLVKHVLSRVSLYFLAILFLVAFVFPFYWMFLSGVRANNHTMDYPPQFIDFNLNLGQIWTKWVDNDFFTYLNNTLVIAIGAAVGQVVAASLVAYGFARFEFPGKRIFFLLMLSGLIIPWDVTMIAQFIEFKDLNWLNSPLPLIIPNCFGSPFIIFVARQYMMTIPREFDEAATIDGCNSLQTLWHIIMPLSRPILVFIFAFQFIYSWNDYLAPLIFISHQENFTLMLGLTTFQTAHTTDWPSVMSVSTVIVLIPFALFLTIQRYLVGGISAEGIKG